MKPISLSDKKPVFDFVRGLIGRSFRRDEIERLDELLDRLQQSSDDEVLAEPMRISQRGVDLIRLFEGCARIRSDGLVEAYPDPGTGGAPWTIGWGATGPGISRGTVWTKSQCADRLSADLDVFSGEVRAAIGNTPTTQAQFDALVSFHYNTGAIRTATLTRRHRSRDYAAAATEFSRWNRAGGRLLKGLIRRRTAEAALYRGEEY
ncbi:glycoside hydrolase family protein [Altererythrobacter aurantiacus]|uniref:Lysozyme n=1 Tax=Parapontixanthobacter aurantiacus TaxID=1463599 RepID=A0A844ZBX0_9SPHN|nr:glycoside hydrolase family protein [Parapontixanthobacter aurantiacus]